MDKCRLCKSEAESKYKNDGELLAVNCQRCGRYEITDSAISIANPATLGRAEWRAAASGWIREQNAVGVVPSFDSKNINRLMLLRKPGLKERAERYLLAAADRSATLQTDFNPTTEDLIGISYSHDERETWILVEYLANQEWLAKRNAGKTYRVTPKGHIAADELRTRRAKSSQGFVAMWFANGMNATYDDGFEPAIRKAGYKPLRIDKREDVVKIDDEILAEIRRSAFVVADFTGHRGGVYFEAGFAMGLGIPIVWTCRQDHMNELHFDIRQYNCLSWTDAGDLAVKLQKRIEGFLGRGPLIDSAELARK